MKNDKYETLSINITQLINSPYNIRFKPILVQILPQIAVQRIQHSEAETHGLFSTHLLFHLVDVVARAVVVDQAVGGGGVGCLVTKSVATTITHLVWA